MSGVQCFLDSLIKAKMRSKYICKCQMFLTLIGFDQDSHKVQIGIGLRLEVLHSR